MWQRLSIWLLRLPYHQKMEHRQAMLIQMLDVGIVIIAVILLPLLLYFSPLPPVGQNILVVTIILVVLVALESVRLVRRGHLETSVLLLSIFLALVSGLLLYATTLAQAWLAMLVFSLPITISGLLVRRQGVAFVLGTGIVSISMAAWLARNSTPGVENLQPFYIVVGFVVVMLMVGVLVSQMGAITRESVAMQRMREQELEALSRRLEDAIHDRTADLVMALDNLELRAADQARLLAENRQQQESIRQLSVPVLPISATTLVMPLVGVLDSERLRVVQDRALEAIARMSARRLLLDITGVPLVDGAVAQGIIRTLNLARLLGAEVALVGVRPEVAQSIIGLGVDLSGMRTYADLQSALL